MTGHFQSFQSPASNSEMVNAVIELSNSESRTLCRRVFSALNYPAGADAELADSIVWLAAVEICPLLYWAEQLPQLEFEPAKGTRVITSQPLASGLNLACDANLMVLVQAVDTLVAKVIQAESESELSYSNPKFARLLLPLILVRSQLNLAFQLNLAPFRCVVVKGELWSNAPLAALKAELETELCLVKCVHLESTAGLSMFKQSELEHHLNCQSIRTISSQRIRIDARSFQLLKQKAAQSFVPNSELSRSSGAGAEVDDSH